VKQLIFHDDHGNGASYRLLVPAAMTHWRIRDFLDFMTRTGADAHDHGYLPRAADPLRHEAFRYLANDPASTLNRPLTYFQNHRPLGPDDSIDLTDHETFVTIRRELQADRPDPNCVDVARHNRRTFAANMLVTAQAVDAMFRFDRYPIVTADGRFLDTFLHVADEFPGNLDAVNKLRFLYRIAALVHAAPFENFSKIVTGIPFRSGAEMWPNMAAGFGGICAEKTAAVKFICDVLNIPSFPIVGASTKIPDDYHQKLRIYIESEGACEPSPWIQHHLIVVEIGGGRFLIDTTNGNVPFLFLNDADMQPFLAHGMQARMVHAVEHLYLRRVPNWVGDVLLTLCEFHVPDLQFQYMFDQGLGMEITSSLYVGAYFDWGGSRSSLMQNYYAVRAKRLRLPYPRFIHEQNLSSVPGRGLRERLAAALGVLREQYADPYYTGDFTFVLQPLAHFWKHPRISRSVRDMLWPDSHEKAA